MGLYLPLDVLWPDDEAIIEVGLDGAGAHAFMGIAKRSETDGWVGRRILARYGIDDQMVTRLSTCEPEPLIETRPDGAVRSVGWHKRNPSQAAIAANRSAKAKAGAKGNHKRWHHDGEYESCAICQGMDSQVVAGSDRRLSHSESGGIAGLSPESETKGSDDCDRISDPVARIRSQERGSPDAAKRALALIPGRSTQEAEAQ